MPIPAPFRRLASALCLLALSGGAVSGGAVSGGVASGGAASARPAAGDVAALLAPVPGVEGPRLADLAGEPVLRVRVRSGVASATLGVAGGRVVVRGGGAAGAGTLLPAPVTLVPARSSFVTADATGARLRWSTDRLFVAAEAPGQPVVLDGGAHPGTLAFSRRADRPGRMDAVERVGLEAYLPGVLDRELYASWGAEAFRAQAVAARSYALWELELSRRAEAAGERVGGRADFDLESTTASQAYGGVAQNPKAAAAAAATRGVVLAWGGRVLPAFYCSATGGPGGDAAHTFPGRAPDLPPLRGRDHGARDGASPRFSWGPVRRPADTLSRRIAAWGARERDPIAALSGLVSIEPVAANRAGRHAAYRLRDASGASYLLRADDLRHAANAPAAGLPAAAGDDRLFSGDFRVRREAGPRGGRFTFYAGRGFGHGVGMSQWGAQAMATDGFGHAEILATYYPGATLAKAYR